MTTEVSVVIATLYGEANGKILTQRLMSVDPRHLQKLCIFM